MNTSRRHAIKLAMCATASLATIEGLCGRRWPTPPRAATGRCRWWLAAKGSVRGCRGQMITVQTSSRSITLWLMEVDDVPNAHHTGAVGDQNSFVVLFQGPRSPKLAQGTYQVESRTLGKFPLFLVPEWTYASVTAYAATFNRLDCRVARRHGGGRGSRSLRRSAVRRSEKLLLSRAKSIGSSSDRRPPTAERRAPTLTPSTP